MKWILLDSGPLGVYTNPKQGDRKDEIRALVKQWELQGHAVAVPEIVDFELRRELLRGSKTDGIANLDDAGDRFLYLALTTPTMRLAAQLWAIARQMGRPTAAPFELDGDVILGAQAQVVEQIGAEVVIATFNTNHLSRYAKALQPRDIV